MLTRNYWRHCFRMCFATDAAAESCGACRPGCSGLGPHLRILSVRQVIPRVIPMPHLCPKHALKHGALLTTGWLSGHAQRPPSQLSHRALQSAHRQGTPPACTSPCMARRLHPMSSYSQAQQASWPLPCNLQGQTPTGTALQARLTAGRLPSRAHPAAQGPSAPLQQ